MGGIIRETKKTTSAWYNGRIEDNPPMIIASLVYKIIQKIWNVEAYTFPSSDQHSQQIKSQSIPADPLSQVGKVSGIAVNQRIEHAFHA